MLYPTLAVAEAWIGVIGALGGVALTGLLGVATAILNNRWSREQKRHEFRRHQAELRREAYARALVATQALVSALFLWSPPSAKSSSWELWADFRQTRADIAHEYDASLRHAHLLAGEAVTHALRDYEQLLRKRLGVVLTAWTERQIPPRESVPRAFDALDNAERRLVEVMAAEQAGDLSP
jgi:hypothetical protein